jgi:hypothetical protein
MARSEADASDTEGTVLAGQHGGCRERTGAVLELGGSDIDDTLSCTIRDQMYEAEQILAGITEAHATTDARLIIRSGTGHVEGYHALILVPYINHTAELLVFCVNNIRREEMSPVVF